MTDRKVLTARVTELFDPELVPPPYGQDLLLINPGGVLITGTWFEGCLAWGFFPKVPETVKRRQRGEGEY